MSDNDRPQRWKTVKLSDWLINEGQSVYVDDNEEAGDTYTLRGGKFYKVRVEYGLLRFEYPEEEVPGSTEIEVQLPSYEIRTYFHVGDAVYFIYNTGGKWITSETVHEIIKIEVAIEARGKYMMCHVAGDSRPKPHINLFMHKEDALLECIRRERMEANDRNHRTRGSEV